MNTVRFYQTVLNFLTRENKDDLVSTKEGKDKIISLASRFAPSWVRPESDLSELDSSGHIVHSDHWEQFILAAFKDLSAQRNPLAHKVLKELMALNKYAVEEDMILWARKIINQKDGSVTIILHASHLERLTRILGIEPDDLEAAAILRFFDKKDSEWVGYTKPRQYK